MLRFLAASACLAFAAAPAHAVMVTVYDAKISYIEVWGGVFTVYMNKTHTATACGHNTSFAIDGTTPAGQLNASTLITAWTSNKTIQVNVTDNTCLGDRPTIQNFYVLNGP